LFFEHDFFTSFIWGYFDTKFEVSSICLSRVMVRGQKMTPHRSWKGSKKPGPNRVKGNHPEKRK